MSCPRMRPAEAPVSMKMHVADEPGPLQLALVGVTEAWRLGANWQVDIWPFCSRQPLLRLSGVTSYRILLLRTVSKL